MVIEYVRYRIPVDDFERFRRAVADATPLLEACSECRFFEVRRGVEDPTECIARVEWESIAGHLQFRDGPSFPVFKGYLSTFTIESIGHYEEL